MRRLLAAGLAAATLILGTGLSAPSMATSAKAASSVEARPSVGAALDHVRRNHRQWGLGAGDVKNLKVTDVYRSSHTGVTHVYLLQLVDSREVTRANMTVNVMPNRSILSVGSRFLSDVSARAGGSLEIDARGAARSAAAHLGLVATTPPLQVSADEGTEKRTLLAWPQVSVSPIPAYLAYEPVTGGGIRLSWQLEIEEPGGRHWWRIAVDAATGDILSQVDYVAEHSHNEQPAARPTYRVYALPTESPNDADRKLLRDPSGRNASPFGWHDTDGARGHEFTTTRGNNVHAYADYTPGANTALPTMDADGGEDLVFDFELDFNDPPHLWRDAAVTNLFYWSNMIHDITYRYGFNEPAGNFQVSNYSGNGVGEDDVHAEAHDGQGVNNANFATPPDGQSPRMQMFLWPNTAHRQLIDGSLDAGVIIHEYGHGISNRLTGGPDNVSCLRNQEQGGEGWSDWLAIAFTARSRAELNKPRGIGTYVLGQEDRHQRGIRPTPYSPNMSINPSTYDTIKSAAVPHGVGYVWATMLWDLYVNLVKKHGFNRNVKDGWRTGGNNLAIQLVMDGMKMQPCEPGFVDARDAILDADEALTGGKNRCIIWKSFARRGLGARAKQGQSTDRSDGTQNFSLPPGC